MDRRRNRRWPRQLEVRFWKRGEEVQALRAISSNVSRTGIFVRTQQVLPSGTRLRLEVMNAGRGFIAEGVVVRALKTPGHLQSVMPSGMGIRFLVLEELLAEMLPGLDLLAEERIPAGMAPPGEAAREASPRPGGPAAGGGAPAGPAGRTPPPSPTITGALFPLLFRDREQFRRAFERDISTGGLFISTDRPPPLDSIVEVEVGVEDAATAPVRLQARVVHRMEPAPGEGDNLLAGMGLQFLDVQRAVELLRSLL